MPGVIVDIKVKVGDTVKEGDLVAVLEAMKMETEIFSSKSGEVAKLLSSRSFDLSQTEKEGFEPSRRSPDLHP